MGPTGAIRGTSYVNWGPDFRNAYNDFTRDHALANSILGRTTAKDQLFTALQTAENARDTAPDAYQAARTAYYTLVNGSAWVEQEKDRIANVEAQPIVDGYVARYNDIQAKKNQQRSTIEVVDGVRDKILTVKDDLVFSVSTFQKQIDDIRNQINKNKAKQSQTIAAASSWVDTFLNWVIALVTLVAIVLLGRKFLGGSPPTIEEVEAKARYIRAQAMLKNANVRGPRGWF
jgi:membrane-associated HD superfamily phosphohydrolase